MSGVLAVAAASAAVVMGVGELDAPATFASLAGVSLVFAWVHLMSASGYRRLPFWLTAVSGTVVLFVVAAARIALPVHEAFAVTAGFLMLVTARMVMARRSLNPTRFTMWFIAGAGGSLLAASVASMGLIGGGALASGELERLVGMLHPAYQRYRDEVDPYVKELAADDQLDANDADRRIQELNERIAQLEGEAARFEAARKELDAYAHEIEQLRLRVRELDSGAMAGLDPADIERVSSYAQAVRPAVPLVRDFAVRLAAEHPGSYYRAPTDQRPAPVGIRQVLTIHRYVAANWHYVNDPLFIAGDYYSPPERTIAVGLVGDCDDFAVLIASAVEAIGGRARIVHGVCPDGAHAWAEVYVGDRPGWDSAIQVVSRMYPGRSVSRTPARDSGDYWLSLDWEAGRLSCGNVPVVQYESSGRKRD